MSIGKTRSKKEANLHKFHCGQKAVPQLFGTVVDKHLPSTAIKNTPQMKIHKHLGAIARREINIRKRLS